MNVEGSLNTVRRASRMFLAAILVGTGLVGASQQPARAQASDIYYTAFLWSRSFETFAQIPAELTQGAPSSYVLLYDQNEPGCRVDAGVYDLSSMDEIAHLSVNAYQNPVKAQATNPETARPTRAEFGTAPGPRAVADCSKATLGSGEASWGGHVSDSASVQSATSSATSERKDGVQLLVTEGITKLAGIKLGEVEIRNVESWLKVEWRPNQEEPVVSYRLMLQGLSNGTTDVASTGGQGIVFSGQNVGGSELAEQFNEQAEAHETTLEQLGTFGVHILAPRSYKDTVTRDVQTFRGWTVDAPVLEAHMGLAARKQQVGNKQGLRIGLNRVAGQISVRD